MSFQLFSIGGIPVSMSPWYLLIFAYWMSGDLVGGLLWGLVVTVSILVHELGHALVARHYRLQPRILLWGMGGLTFHERAERDRHDALIVAAGPGAGLVLGGISLVVFLFVPITNYRIHSVVQMMLYVNIIWSFVNLLPMWPLDGGQLFRLGMLQITKPATADKITHYVSFPFLLTGVALAFAWHSIFLGLIAGFGIWQNVRALRGEVSSGAVRPGASKEAKALLVEAKKAYAAGDFAEAARHCHRIREHSNVGEATLRDTWAILGPATTRLGDHRSAIRFLERAPDTPDVIEAKIECFHQLDQQDDLDALLASKAFGKLPAARREEILGVIRGAPFRE